MLGPHLLVASVLDPHATERSLILPYNGGGGSSGTWWCDIWTGKWYFATNENNNNKITVPVPLEQCGAVFACQGALIPMSVHGIRCNAEEWQKDERMVWAFPPPPFSSTSSSAHRYEYTLMEDDGESMHSKTTRLRLWMQVGAKEEVEQEGGMGVILVGVEVEQHDFPLPYSAITFVMPVGETRRVKVVKNPKLDLLIK